MLLLQYSHHNLINQNTHQLQYCYEEIEHLLTYNSWIVSHIVFIANRQNESKNRSCQVHAHNDKVLFVILKASVIPFLLSCSASLSASELSVARVNPFKILLMRFASDKLTFQGLCLFIFASQNNTSKKEGCTITFGSKT